MDNLENGAVAAHASRLKPPTINALTALREVSDSQNNVRQPVSQLPTAPTGLKRQHTDTNIRQPEPKRKTTSERVRDFGRSIASAPTAGRGAPTGKSLASLSGNQTTGATSYSRQQSNGPRPVSSNYGKPSGYGPRPVTAHGERPQSFSKSVSGNRPRSHTRNTRPGTSMAYTDMEVEPVGNKQQNAWDVDERLHEVESQFKAMKEVMNGSLNDRKAVEEAIELAKTRANDMERDRNSLLEKNSALQSEMNEMRHQVQALTLDLETERRSHKFDLDGRNRDHQHDLNELRRELEDETERQQRDHREALEALERHYRAELEDERSQKSRQVDELRTKLDSEQQDLHVTLQGKDRELQTLQSQVDALKRDLEQEQASKKTLQQQFAELSTTNMALEDRGRALRAQIDFLESDSKQQSDSFASMEARLQDALRIAEEARQKLIKEETERRVLFNKYQELKGNIRVMCRVRPVLDNSEGDEAKIAFPDLKTSAQIDVTGPEEKSSLGNVTRKTIPFEFDRVFAPAVQNEDVFGEISQLVQSALDGYNVCIFCYGQTGSGKTYTMSSPDGMIPRATHMIYDTITQLREKSWTYTMEGSFVEVYNEELNDLLTSNRESDPKKKLEIRHDDARKQTTVVNCRTVRLDSPDMVETMLRQAQNNRSVAATKANERSSRSHSVFILRLSGENGATGERCEGTLNLVDLAGSERLKHSQAEGERMRETQNINKSLACLGDVIEALGRKGGAAGAAHIPYRNSKLTHLLQYSLGGNSKTLMFVMVSPLEAHLKETITSLRFATKVHNTHIGTAKSTKKLKE